MFDDIIKTALVGVSDDVKKTLENELKHVAEEFLSHSVIDKAVKILLKGIDSVIAASVKVLPSIQADKVATVYLNEIDKQFVQLKMAISGYIPLQVNVEMQKHRFGNQSNEANDARERRKAGIDEVKAEFGDVFAAILGGHVSD
jgi:hypothetical protein